MVRPAVVTRTVDGDTIHVTFRGHDLDVRLIGIDTPRRSTPRSPSSVSASRRRGSLDDPYRTDRAVGVRHGAARSVRAHARVRLAG